MLNHELRPNNGPLVLRSEGPLVAADFTAIAHQVDAFLADGGKLGGVLLIYANSFSGWDDFGAALAHLQFLKQHLPHVEDVAVVADGVFARAMRNTASQFIHAKITDFAPRDENSAWAWFGESTTVQQRSAA
jgi:hypothetical protein